MSNFIFQKYGIIYLLFLCWNFRELLFSLLILVINFLSQKHMGAQEQVKPEWWINSSFKCWTCVFFFFSGNIVATGHKMVSHLKILEIKSPYNHNSGCSLYILNSFKRGDVGESWVCSYLSSSVCSYLYL